MLARDLRQALDPVAFFRESLRMDPDRHQAAILRGRGYRDALNCTRKWGKTTTVGGAALHEGNYVAGSKIVVIAPSSRQSSILLGKVEELADVARVRVSKRPGDDPGLLLPLGELIALPGSEATIRGLEGTTWLIVDEAARVPDAVYYAARPFLANTNGRISLMSTPFGKRGFFYSEVHSGRFDVTCVPATECPRISPQFLADERLTLPDSWFRQEYLCEFTSVQHAMFDHDLVLKSLAPELQPLCL